MGTITAQRVLDESRYTVRQISTTNLEYLIDRAINFINAETGSSISNLSGSPLSVTVTGAQEMAVKALSELLLRAYLDKGPNVGVAGLSVTQVMADPHYKTYSKLFRMSLDRLRGRSFEKV